MDELNEWDLGGTLSEAGQPAISEPVRPRKPRRAGTSRASSQSARRAMEKLIAVQTASPEERASAAALLAVQPDDDVRLALACLTMTRSAVGDPGRDVLAVADAPTPLEAMELAVTLAGERPKRFELAVRMLRAVNPDLGAVPPQPGRAARVFTEAARSLNDQQRSALVPSALIG